MTNTITATSQQRIIQIIQKKNKELLELENQLQAYIESTKRFGLPVNTQVAQLQIDNLKDYIARLKSIALKNNIPEDTILSALN